MINSIAIALVDMLPFLLSEDLADERFVRICCAQISSTEISCQRIGVEPFLEDPHGFINRSSAVLRCPINNCCLVEPST